MSTYPEGIPGMTGEFQTREKGGGEMSEHDPNDLISGSFAREAMVRAKGSQVSRGNSRRTWMRERVLVVAGRNPPHVREKNRPINE